MNKLFVQTFIRTNIQTKLKQLDYYTPRIVRWIGWYCSLDPQFNNRALAVWEQARYFSSTEAPRNTESWSVWERNIFKPPYQSGDKPIIFDVTVKQHEALHQGHRFMFLCALVWIEKNIQHNRFLSNVVFHARLWFRKKLETVALFSLLTNI